MRANVHLSAASRRGFLAGGGGWLLAGGLAQAAAPHAASAVSPSDALKRLMAGNTRFTHNRSVHPDLGAERRKSLVSSQHPFATILACSDSRVAPELIFDQGLGDLFVIRVAGNVVDDTVLASIEYSVIHTGSPLVMVLSHARCGAVTATMEALAGKGSEEDKDTRIGALANLIAPAVHAVPPQTPEKLKLETAIVLNAERAATAILTGSAPLRAHVQSGALRVVSARYELEDGSISHLRNAQV
jgi:carbonic anhydrase